MAAIIEHVNAKENQRICQEVHKAIRAGVLVKSADCAWCGSTRQIVAHHPDYARPLMVVWICRKCHADHHRLYHDEALIFRDGF